MCLLIDVSYPHMANSNKDKTIMLACGTQMLQQVCSYLQLIHLWNKVEKEVKYIKKVYAT